MKLERNMSVIGLVLSIQTGNFVCRFLIKYYLEGTITDWF